jgi:hypothetical protein
MPNARLRTLIHFAAFVSLLFTPYVANADCYGWPPPASPVSAQVGSTNISISSISSSPVDSLSGVILQISNSLVSKTTTWYQPGYDTWCEVCDNYGCYDKHTYVPGYYFDTYGSIYPIGTATIKQDDVGVGTVSISGATTTYTTPPVQKVGTLNFVVQFSPTPNSGFTLATSNTVTLLSQLNPGILMSIINTVLDE